MLRLKSAHGNPRVAELAVGRNLTVRAPDGRERTVRILAHSITGGNVSQERLDRVRELDVVVAPTDDTDARDPVGFGWTVRPAE
jgi:hypothetical protein